MAGLCMSRIRMLGLARYIHYSGVLVACTGSASENVQYLSVDILLPSSCMSTSSLSCFLDVQMFALIPM